MIRALRKVVLGKARDEEGAATLEFCLVVPAFIGIMISSFESGLMMVRNVMLERGVDFAVRELRLGQPVPPTFQQLKDTICANALIIADCNDRIQLELSPIDMATFSMPTTAPRCIDIDSEIDPIDDTTFIGGGNNDLMLVRVCALFQPMFITTGWGMNMPTDGNGNYALVVKSAFVNEPTR